MTCFMLIGGFLGAGKTTAILRLARAYSGAGRRVAIISNDQADGLVDTATFRSHGLATEEVPGGCFCCRFDELIAAAGRLEDGHHPDIILAEPVGSCTDIVSTVIKPLQRLYADRFRVAPYVALLDPHRAQQALSGRGGFSEKVTYIYKMQQHEAAVIAINKADTLDALELRDLQALVARSFPSAQQIALSARSGAGFDELLALLAGDGGASAAVDVDYDLYAEGEAQLGWLNGACRLVAPDAFEVGAFLLGAAGEIGRRLIEQGHEPAHIKLLARTGDRQLVCNLVSGAQSPELSSDDDYNAATAELVINVRAEAAPDELRAVVQSSIERAASDRRASAVDVTLTAFAPGRPIPQHRLR